ncbi:MAG: VWA domain-containing protein [Deltaproteobacteria bacterium]|jgi:Ca-activated chloride channel family protein|nr:VWA domain-containing protein [Deltaproteobacteria bacterium]
MPVAKIAKSSKTERNNERKPKGFSKARKRPGRVTLAALTGLIIMVAVLAISSYVIIWFVFRDVRTQPVNLDEDNKRLVSLITGIKVKNKELFEHVKSRDSVNLGPVFLPDISHYPRAVPLAHGKINVEIVAASENPGLRSREAFPVPTGPPDGYESLIIELAKRYNASGRTVDGKETNVGVRAIPSGIATRYLVSGKYVPDAFNPATRLWAESLAKNDVKMELLDKGLAGNVAGLVLDKPGHAFVTGKYGEVTAETVMLAARRGEIVFGITNPTFSSVGTNFLLSALCGPKQKVPPADEKTLRLFSLFLEHAPVVANNTRDLLEAAEAGALDGFLLEYHKFLLSDTLGDRRVFTPFGSRHDNPLYALGNLEPEKRKVLRDFIDFAKSPESKKLVRESGFDGLPDYRLGENDTGRFLPKALDIYRQKKDGIKKRIAVFAVDLSPSMDGRPTERMKKHLLLASRIIHQNSLVGLVTFGSKGSNVTIAIPLKQFNLKNRLEFMETVKKLEAAKGPDVRESAAASAILIAEKLLVEEKLYEPRAKMLVMVLSDGLYNEGRTVKEILPLAKDLDIPVHVMNFGNNRNLAELPENTGGVFMRADGDERDNRVKRTLNALF